MSILKYFSPNNLHRDGGIHLNLKRRAALDENFISRILRFWYDTNSSRELKQSNNNVLLKSNFESLIIRISDKYKLKFKF